MSIDVCSLLLVYRCEFDIDGIHHGRTNNNTLMYKDKKITLVTMNPAKIVKHEQDKLNNAKEKSVLQSRKQQSIKLKRPSFLATKTGLIELMLFLVMLCFRLQTCFVFT